jgi:hypothetical protein
MKELSFLYGGILVLGGVMGFMKGSTVSLVAGASCGAIIALSELTGTSLSWVQASVSGCVAAFMLKGYLETSKPHQLGTALLSGLALALYAYRALSGKAKL